MIHEERESSAIVPKIKMLRNVEESTSFLLVEGSDDSRFWKTRCRDSCDIIICGSRHSTINAILRIDQRKINAVLGVIDDDLDSLLGRTLFSQNLFFTDGRDLEAQLLASLALEKTVEELVEPCHIVSFEQKIGMSVREALVERCLLLGKVHYVIRKKGLPCSVPVRECINSSEWTVNENSLIEKLSVYLNVEEVKEFLSKIPAHDPWSLIRGHDALEILCLALSRKDGVLPTSAQPMNHKHLRRYLHLAYDAEMFFSTRLASDIGRWELRNVAVLR